MILDQTIDRAVSAMLIREDEEERLSHISSGKLTASALGKPLQWQILHIIGVPSRPLDEYVLRYFKRGKDIEDWLIKSMPGVVEKQKLMVYQDCIGYADTIIDTSCYECNKGIIPNEIKSVKNSKYARILAQKQPDRSHALQASLYALAMGSKHFGISYIAADDLRITHWILDTKDYAREVHQIIKAYQEQIGRHTLPEFDPPEKWMASLQYSDYPDWMKLSESECMDKLKDEYPDCYEKLIKL